MAYKQALEATQHGNPDTRIQAILKFQEDHGELEAEGIVVALCEIARQLVRIADCYEEAHK